MFQLVDIAYDYKIKTTKLTVYWNIYVYVECMSVGDVLNKLVCFCLILNYKANYVNVVYINLSNRRLLSHNIINSLDSDWRNYRQYEKLTTSLFPSMPEKERIVGMRRATKPSQCFLKKACSEMLMSWALLLLKKIKITAVMSSCSE